MHAPYTRSRCVSSPQWLAVTAVSQSLRMRRRDSLSHGARTCLTHAHGKQCSTALPCRKQMFSGQQQLPDAAPLPQQSPITRSREALQRSAHGSKATGTAMHTAKTRVRCDQHLHAAQSQLQVNHRLSANNPRNKLHCARSPSYTTLYSAHSTSNYHPLQSHHTQPDKTQSEVHTVRGHSSPHQQSHPALVTHTPPSMNVCIVRLCKPLPLQSTNSHCLAGAAPTAHAQRTICDDSPDHTKTTCTAQQVQAAVSSQAPS